MSGALVVTAEFAGPDQAWLNRIRRQYFPPERNHLDAHLTIFHALPPSAEAEVRHRLSEQSRAKGPRASIEGLMNLGGGVAYRIVSVELDHIRDNLAGEFHGLLGAQDSGGWRPHVTIQNKVPVKDAHALLESLERDFEPRALRISGLGLHRYLGGPWERLGIFSFRGV